MNSCRKAREEASSVEGKKIKKSVGNTPSLGPDGPQGSARHRLTRRNWISGGVGGGDQIFARETLKEQSEKDGETARGNNGQTACEAKHKGG